MATNDTQLALARALGGLTFTGAETPYGLGTGVLAQTTPTLINPYGSVGKNALIGLGGTLMTALLGYQAKKQAAEKSLMAQELGLKLAGLQSPEERLGMIKSVEDSDVQRKLLDVNAAIAEQNALTKALNAQKKQDAIIEFTKAGIKENLLTPEQFAMLIEAPQLVQKQSQTQTPETSYGKPIESKLFEGETLDEKRNRYIEQGKRMGLTPNKAADDADRRIAVEKQSNTATVKKIEESRNKANIVSNLAAIASEGVAGAGSTGGPALYAGGRELASSLYQYLPTEGGRQEAQQRASTRVLDSIRPEIVKAGRSPGAVTDFENKLLIGAGPSSDKTPEENKALIKGMEQRAQLDNEYADFLETYLNQKGSSLGADKLWSEYKKNEVFAGGKYNPDRRSWQDYLGTKRGIAPTTDTSAEKQALIAQIKAAIAAKQGK